MGLLSDAKAKQPDRDLDSIYDMMVEYQDFPKPGKPFVDVFPILRDPQALQVVVNRFVDHLRDKQVDVIVGLEARGFVLGPAVAIGLGIPFVPIRKKNKLPGDCFSVSYEKEYGPDVLEIQKGSIPPGAKVVTMDDVLATGGTAQAAEKLIRMMEAVPLETNVILEGKILKGADLLEAPVFSLFQI
ncbi:adenine phosphoribosyltransferase [Lichtheimia corymbifera JMRC:FSU:9682]|uniref:adenine phosphoribosyltransferase n=1 Tax=Lichtheimia corymbifera JMRC:FSU:9682 TaxID=1263082 RepID=A0A068RHL4_9FUNG|nr:adenine phosphoribosyltransferase [Lichtheimia corymbifera JMRC:FSU:9682]